MKRKTLSALALAFLALTGCSGKSDKQLRAAQERLARTVATQTDMRLEKSYLSATEAFLATTRRRGSELLLETYSLCFEEAPSTCREKYTRDRIVCETRYTDSDPLSRLFSDGRPIDGLLENMANRAREIGSEDQRYSLVDGIRRIREAEEDVYSFSPKSRAEIKKLASFVQDALKPLPR
jgi:hypothetical protein